MVSIKKKKKKTQKVVFIDAFPLGCKLPKGEGCVSPLWHQHLVLILEQIFIERMNRWMSEFVFIISSELPTSIF